MEAYTESVEASRQRLTVAVEQWALKLNQSDALKAFYDGLTFLVENIHTVALTLLGIASFANFEKVATSAGWVKELEREDNEHEKYINLGEISNQIQ